HPQRSTQPWCCVVVPRRIRAQIKGPTTPTKVQFPSSRGGTNTSHAVPLRTSSTDLPLRSSSRTRVEVGVDRTRTDGPVNPPVGRVPLQLVHCSWQGPRRAGAGARTAAEAGSGRASGVGSCEKGKRAGSGHQRPGLPEVGPDRGGGQLGAAELEVVGDDLEDL